MFIKDVGEISLLFDFYGDLLTGRKQSVLNLYYNEDFSLAEIADEIGISRQGVRDLIKKGEEELRAFEEKLGLVARDEHIREHLKALREGLLMPEIPRAELLSKLEELSALFR